MIRLDDGDGPDDGCEVYFNSLTYCGTSCTDRVACSAIQVCNAGLCSAPQGVAKLSVPLTASGQVHRFASKFPKLPNLTNGELIVRLYAPGATGGELNLYPNDADYSGLPAGVVVPFVELSRGWTDVKVLVGGVNGAFDPTVVSQISIEFNASGAGPWTNPTVLYIDGVRSADGAINDTFDTSINSVVSSSSVKVAGSAMTWLSAMP